MSKIKVLLADDHAVVRDGLRALLEAEDDIQVVALASNGIEAVQLVGQTNPDVVVMDIAMPDLNGIEATRQICEIPFQTQVVILSIHATVEHIQRAFEAGAMGYLLKESAGSEVVTAVRSVHEGNRYSSRKVADMVQEHLVGQIEEPLAILSGREREVFYLMVDGKTSAEAAQILSLSPKSVETYRSRIMQKLDIHDIPSLVKFAIRHRLISLE